MQFKKFLFVLFNPTAESVNCSLLKNLEKHFCDLTYKKKNFIKHIENLPQHLSKKFIGDNLSITDIALKNWDLSIIGIAQSIFEIIDYRYRFSTERFIVPITDGNVYQKRWSKVKVKLTIDKDSFLRSIV